MTDERIERDTFGDIAVAADRLWGAQTQRSLHHFDISTERMPDELIWALAMVKRSAAVVNRALGTLDPRKADAIAAAADEVLNGEHPSQFPLSVWQTGSGTQTNMNLNEVLANRASQLLGGPLGEGRLVHPERRRQPRAVVERRLPDRDERGRGAGDRDPAAAGARRPCGRPWPRRPRRSTTSSRSVGPTCRTRRR